MNTIYTLENLPEFWERSLPMDNAFIFAITVGILAFVTGLIIGFRLSIDNLECEELTDENLNLIDEVYKLKNEIEKMNNENLKFLKK